MSKKHLLFAFIFATGIFLQISTALANPPAWVYRIDTREPSEIFLTGFSPRGDNDNLADHFLSVSYYDGTSSFVGTTSEFHAALMFASGILRHAPTGEIYVYAIRPDHSFYSVAASIQHHVAMIGASAELRSRLPNYLQRLQRAQIDYRWEREWVTQGVIPANQIAWSLAVTNSHDRYPGTEAFVRVASPEANVNVFFPSPTYGSTDPLGIALPDNDSPEAGFDDDEHNDDAFDPLDAALSNDSFAVGATTGWVHPHHVLDCAPTSSSDRKKRSHNTSRASRGGIQAQTKEESGIIQTNNSTRRRRTGQLEDRSAKDKAPPLCRIVNLSRVYRYAQLLAIVL